MRRANGAKESGRSAEIAESPHAIFCLSDWFRFLLWLWTTNTGRTPRHVLNVWQKYHQHQAAHQYSPVTRKLRRAHEGCSWDAWATTPMSIATTFSRFGVSITQHFKNRRSPLHLHPSSLLPFSAIYLPPVPFVPLDPPVELLASWVTKRVASRARLATTCRWTLGLATSKERAETLDKLAARNQFGWEATWRNTMVSEISLPIWGLFKNNP